MSQSYQPLFFDKPVLVVSVFPAFAGKNDPSIMPGSCFVARLCTFSIACLYFCLYGDHTHDAYSRWLLTRALYSGVKLMTFNVVKDLRITAIMLLALLIC